MKTLKIILAGILLLTLFGCATKDEGPEAFKNMSAKELLAAAEKDLAKNNPTDATKKFEALDALYPFDPEAQQGQLDVIYAYYKADDETSALAAADRYIHLYPEGEHADYAYYMKGVVNFDRGRNWLQKLYTAHAEELDLVNLREAFVDFNDLIKQFPHSVYVKDAHARMIYIRDLLADRELVTANFYLDHKAYIAAANRASYIVKHFEGAPQVPAALKIMIKSYQALGATKQASDAERVLQLNYPGSKV